MRAESLAVLLDMLLGSVVSWFAARLELQEKRECRRRMQIGKQLRVLINAVERNADYGGRNEKVMLIFNLKLY